MTINHSGVQAHSQGDHYPFIVYGQQADADSPVLYGVMGGGIEPRIVGTCEEAIIEAQRLKQASLNEDDSPEDISALIDAAMVELMRQNALRPIAPADLSIMARSAASSRDLVALGAIERFARFRHFVDF